MGDPTATTVPITQAQLDAEVIAARRALPLSALRLTKPQHDGATCRIEFRAATVKKLALIEPETSLPRRLARTVPEPSTPSRATVQ